MTIKKSLIIIIILMFSITSIEVIGKKNSGTNSNLINRPNELEKNICRTLYPIVVAHHWGPPRHRECDAEGKCIDYFYRPVIAILRDRGADIRVSEYSHDYDTTPNRARELKDFIFKSYINNPAYMVKWKATHPGRDFKVNIIGHSQGCQDSRYMISNLGIERYIATWTGLTGESMGTPVADFFIDLYDYFTSKNVLLKWIIDRILIATDSTYSSQVELDRYIASVRCLTERYMQQTGTYAEGEYREGTGYQAAYLESVYYQDWAAKVKQVPDEWSDLSLQWRFIRCMRGDNDIWTPVSSQIHHDDCVVHRGILEGEESSPGVHHMAFSGSLNCKNPGFDQDRFWIDLVADLKNKGY